MKVYTVVSQAEYEGYDIVSVWTNRAKAVEIAVGLEKPGRWNLKYSEVEVPYNQDGIYVMDLEVNE